MTYTSPPRLALLRDGTAVGCFTLCTHDTHVVVLEPNGHAYAYVGPRGRPSRHLTPTLLSAHRDLVGTTIRFRNRYASCASDCQLLPYLHYAAGYSSATLSGGRPRNRSTVCWPTAESYATRGLWNDREQLFEVESMEGSARVQLHASGKIVFARFPMQLKSESDLDVQHAWVEQTFPIGGTPECFAFPVQLLLRARIARGSRADTFRFERRHGDLSAFSFPPNGAFDARPTFRRLFDDDAASTGGSLAAEEVSVEAIARWVRGMSRSMDRLVAAEEVDGLDVVVAHDDAIPAVLVMDGASRGGVRMAPVIECDRVFFRAFNAAGAVAMQFTVETMPLELDLFGHDFHRTRRCLHHAAELYHATCSDVSLDLDRSRLTHTVASAATDSEPASVVEDLTNDAGRFRAFSDGRVRVVFTDRTILQVASTDYGDDCTFTYRDGAVGRCTSDSASPLQQRYLAIANDFAQWAFATHEQRFRRYQSQLEQQLLVARELHKITIRQELNRAKVDGGSQQRGTVLAHLPAALYCRDDDSEGALSTETVEKLQQETQWHMAHVQTLLKGDTHRD